ncbi:MAG: proline dehydrogenase family protein [Pirellulaceae bacterium]
MKNHNPVVYQALSAIGKEGIVATRARRVLIRFYTGGQISPTIGDYAPPCSARKLLSEAVSAGSRDFDGDLSAVNRMASREAVEQLLGKCESLSTEQQLIDLAVQLAGQLLQRAKALQTSEERRQQRELDKMIQNPADKATLTQLTDQAFRSSVPHRAADQLVHILDVQGIPRFFSPFQRTLLKGFQSFGSYLPGVAVPLVKDRMRQETANVILPAEPELLATHLRLRRDEGLRMNVNHLGEALLGEKQAQRRLNAYLDLLQLPEIEVISVKISTIYSQISTLAREHTLRILADRLELLYRAAVKEPFLRRDGTQVTKFVYLDMEEYRDLDLTAELFMRTLDRPGLEQVEAGMALQAYIPDAYLVQQRINRWARKRVAEGRAPVTLRIVKGANLEMERVEASHRGWPQTPYLQKVDTDANYKRMLFEGFKQENLAAVRLGIASHNLFDVALGILLATRAESWDSVQFEMLEGMANHQRRALFEVVDSLLLYAPACNRREFTHAIGYLVRRLDENTGEENFLRHIFQLTYGDRQWQRLELGFRKSFQRISQLSFEPRRTQNRSRSHLPAASASPRQPATGMSNLPVTMADFDNEPDTDFALPANIDWAEQLRDKWMRRCDDSAITIPLSIAGEEKWEGCQHGVSFDPSRPGTVACRFAMAADEDIDRVVAAAQRDQGGWRGLSWQERSQILAGVSSEIRLARADLIGASLADAGKTVLESDPEVSEAVDFVEYYRRTAYVMASRERVRARSYGVVAVVSPWNFPIAIPCGGISAALAAGNTVVLKPASDTVLPAYVLCQCFWRAGVPSDALQLIPCSGATVGQRLVSHPDVDAVVLTGGTATALHMLKHSPAMKLYAETGGKNATIVTALADRDQVVKHVLHSAFSHSGQKCSATSLLLLEEEVFHDASFRDSLCDAVESLEVGSAWDLKNRLGPLIRPPSGDLERGLKELEHGEHWAVMPCCRDENPQLYSPGVKWNVQAGSYTHMTEFFGPLLGVMPIRSLQEGIYEVNATGYGLTSGLESLDDRELELWMSGIRAGNLYANRSTTGAIVHRQPFGGMGKSAFGAGIKAGGPNYTSLFMKFSMATDVSPTAQSEIRHTHLRDLLRRVAEQIGLMDGLDDAVVGRLTSAFSSYETAFAEEFGQEHDDFRIVGQDNLRRYLPVHGIRIRITADDDAFGILARVAAARVAGCHPTVISRPMDLDEPLVNALDEWTESWGAAVEFVIEDDETLGELLAGQHTQRIRYSSPGKVPQSVRTATAVSGAFIADTPILSDGRLELIWYLMEQSISVDYHRYGNLGARSLEERRPVN